FVVGGDRVDRALVDTRPAVDARVRIDVEHLRRGEGGFVGRRVDAVDRADLDTRDVVATRLGDYISHSCTCLQCRFRTTNGPQTSTRSSFGREPRSQNNIIVFPAVEVPQMSISALDSMRKPILRV